VLEVQPVRLPRVTGEQVGGSLPFGQLSHRHLHLLFPGERHLPVDHPQRPGRGQERAQAAQPAPDRARGQAPPTQVDGVVEEPAPGGLPVPEQGRHCRLHGGPLEAGVVLQVGQVGPDGEG
jgi:hypothetical protein